MNLITCPACGNGVSPRAVACPKCGDPMQSELETVPSTANPSNNPLNKVVEEIAISEQNKSANSDVVPVKPTEITPAQASSEKQQKSNRPIWGLLLLVTIIGAVFYYAWETDRTRRQRTAETEKVDDLDTIYSALQRQRAETRLEKLRQASSFSFIVSAARQFEEAPNGKGFFDTSIVINGIPQRCVVVARPEIFTSNGLVMRSFNATKIMRHKFTMTITAPSGITSDREDFYDVYEVVEQMDLERAEEQLKSFNK